MDINGRNERTVVKGTSIGIWHPSGKKIAYYKGKSYNYSTYIMDLKTKETKLLISKKNNPSDWSPDGKYINIVSTFFDMNGKRVKTEFKDIPTYGRFSPDGIKMVGGNLDISYSKVGDEKETVLLKDYSEKY